MNIHRLKVLAMLTTLSVLKVNKFKREAETNVENSLSQTQISNFGAELDSDKKKL